MTMRLLTLPYSHYCEKARWALDLSDLDYVEEAHLPLFHAFHNFKAGAKRTVPALITDSQILTDSTDIIRFADQHGAQLFPKNDPQSTASWEALFDRSLGPAARVWAYSYLLERDDILLRLTETGLAHERKLIPHLLPRIKKAIQGMYRIYPSFIQKQRQLISDTWAQTDRVLQKQAYLVGDTFSAADLTLAALGGILVLPENYGFRYPELNTYPEAMQQEILDFRATTTGQHILKVYHSHRLPEIRDPKIQTKEQGDDST